MWKIPEEQIQIAIGNWLRDNQEKEIIGIKHDSFQGIWVAPQLNCFHLLQKAVRPKE